MKERPATALASASVAPFQPPRDKIANPRVSSLQTWWLIAAIAGNDLDGLAHLGTRKMRRLKLLSFHDSSFTTRVRPTRNIRAGCVVNA
jgi:hypothetical protein